MTEKKDPDELLGNLPHAFPFRMIDRVLEVEPGKRATVLKNVSVDDPILQGHFPGEPRMPGVLILEALAQTAGLAAYSPGQNGSGKEGVPYLAAIEQFRLMGKVIPGDQIILEAVVLKVFSNLAKVKVLARVGEETVSEGIFVLTKTL